MAVERNRAADGRGRSTVLALPERVADHRSRRPAAAHVVLPGEHAPGDGGHAEDVEELAAHPESLDGTRLPAARQIEPRGPPGEHTRERLVSVADLLPDGVRHLRAAAGHGSPPAGGANL